VKVDNPYISQMMTVEQAAWGVRNTVGEGSLLLSVGLAKGHVPDNARDLWNSAQGGGRAIWSLIDGALVGLDISDSFRQTLGDAKAAMFDPEYLKLQRDLLEALATGKTPSMTTDVWSARTVPTLNLMVKVADAALGQAALRASDKIDAAWHDVIWQAVLLLASVLAAAGGYLFVMRRITSPLLRLRAATERLAAGDFTASAEIAHHDDEIGSIAEALATFRQQAIEKARLEEEQAGTRAKAEQRQIRVDGHIGDFQGGVSMALRALDAARGQLGSTAGEMIHIAERGASGVHDAERATSEASDNVSGIAAATEELSASISEIARQVEQAARVSLRAVEETQQTDETVRGLAESASRIGEVVGLISNIAAQTNLLALNATIEAARAGEAGKGFAVVASEVKSLANQTAKATEEIGKQIASVRTVTQDAVKAISQIRGTIDEVNTVATSIASAIEEQGAAMQEIARNTQQAADRTRQASGSVSAVSAETEATTKSASAVQAAAASLGTEAGHLREQIDTFMERLRAA
jgi:methyl-accepting chemotaxis protein